MNPLNPFEKYSIGLIGRPSRRLHLFTEIKSDNTNNTETTVGFRARFGGGSVTGCIGTNGKATSIYKHAVDLFELGFSTQMNFKRPEQPVSFGVTLNMMGM